MDLTRTRSPFYLAGHSDFSTTRRYVRARPENLLPLRQQFNAKDVTLLWSLNPKPAKLPPGLLNRKARFYGKAETIRFASTPS